MHVCFGCGECAVPGKAPAVTSGAYEIVQDGTDKQTRIKLYWQVRCRCHVSVCLSVCVSVTLGIVSKRLNMV